VAADPTKIVIMGNDLVKIAKEKSNFLDFRLFRQIIDAVKEKRIKSYKESNVLASLIRVLIFESTRLTSNPIPEEVKNLVTYDISMHKLLSLEQLFCFNKLHVVTKGLHTCPVRSFFVFAHN